MKSWRLAAQEVDGKMKKKQAHECVDPMSSQPRTCHTLNAPETDAAMSDGLSLGSRVSISG